MTWTDEDGYERLVTGEFALWGEADRVKLDRCVMCERHASTQSHHHRCPMAQEA